jgi:thiamine-phosphate pyrophosphorylase
MHLYAISNRKLLEGDDAAQRQGLVALAAEWTRGGVDTIQLREKDLALAELQALAAQVVDAVRGAGAPGGAGRKTCVLVNGPAQVALDAGADGVHLHAGMGAAAVQAAHQVYERAGREAVVSAACHTEDEIRQSTGASLLLFSPVFEKVTEPARRGQGLTALRSAVNVANPTPVLALGGVTEKNAAACVQAGAAGVAAIRLFLGEGWKGLKDSV